VTESHRLAGVYVGRVLKGDKPATLPVQQVTKLAFAVNLRSAARFARAGAGRPVSIRWY
jgi:putative ABC transport system substrate-binding protein